MLKTDRGNKQIGDPKMYKIVDTFNGFEGKLFNSFKQAEQALDKDFDKWCKHNPELSSYSYRKEVVNAALTWTLTNYGWEWV